MQLKRWLRIVGLGLALWSLGLLWPEVNRLLSPPVMLGLVAWLGLAILYYVAGLQPPEQGPPRNGEARQNCSSRPVPTVQ